VVRTALDKPSISKGDAGLVDYGSSMSTPTARSVAKELEALGTPEKARASARFFKTAEGQYAHGDVFFGVTAPEQRTVAKRHRALPLPQVALLLEHEAHECRLTGLLILVEQYRKADAAGRAVVARFYLAHKSRVNNWDLVDSSAPHILGDYLLTRDRAILYRLARSKQVWDRRIAVVATQAFIRNGEFEDTLAVARLLLADPHDLIHKAVGWMLREVGDRSQEVEERFLKQHAAAMPRTMLRYAIEKFPEADRRRYLRRTRTDPSPRPRS
jgi:3-methyladenine DNA glycosylase AlkD